jgi:hypothetical protein
MSGVSRIRLEPSPDCARRSYRVPGLKAADEIARDFKCGTDAVKVIGSKRPRGRTGDGALI